MDVVIGSKYACVQVVRLHVASYHIQASIHLLG